MYNTYATNSNEYRRIFWDAAKGKKVDSQLLIGLSSNDHGALAAPDDFGRKCTEVIEKNGVMHRLCSVVDAFEHGSRIFAKDCADYADWIPEGAEIPIYEGIDDFTTYSVDMHKIAAFVKFSTSFVYDAAFDLEGHLADSLGRNIAHAEDKGFITGTGTDTPYGILDEKNGAETGVSAESLTFDNVISLFFSVKPEYRRNGTWLMNDETALALRLLKDSDGNYLWNQASDTILGRPVEISEYMPAAESGSSPILFGDFRYYWIMRRTPIHVRTLQEKFAVLNQIGYLATEFLDGRLIRRDAVKALTIAASAKNV